MKITLELRAIDSVPLIPNDAPLNPGAIDTRTNDPLIIIDDTSKFVSLCSFPYGRCMNERFKYWFSESDIKKAIEEAQLAEQDSSNLLDEIKDLKGRIEKIESIYWSHIRDWLKAHEAIIEPKGGESPSRPASEPPKHEEDVLVELETPAGIKDDMRVFGQPLDNGIFCKKCGERLDVFPVVCGPMGGKKVLANPCVCTWPEPAASPWYPASEPPEDRRCVMVEYENYNGINITRALFRGDVFVYLDNPIPGTPIRWMEVPK